MPARRLRRALAHPHAATGNGSPVSWPPTSRVTAYVHDKVVAVSPCTPRWSRDLQSFLSAPTVGRYVSCNRLPSSESSAAAEPVRLTITGPGVTLMTATSMTASRASVRQEGRRRWTNVDPPLPPARPLGPPTPAVPTAAGLIVSMWTHVVRAPRRWRGTSSTSQRRRAGGKGEIPPETHCAALEGTRANAWASMGGGGGLFQQLRRD